MCDSLFETKRVFKGGLLKTENFLARVEIKKSLGYKNAVSICTVNGSLEPKIQHFQAKDLWELADILIEIADYLEAE